MEPHREAAREREALAFWGGRGAVRLIDSGPWGSLLIEGCRPGTHLGDLDSTPQVDGRRVVEVGARILGELHRAPTHDHPFERLEDVMEEWSELTRRRYAEMGGPLRRSLVERGAALLVDLARSAESSVVLHGDFHHWNILSEGGSWLAIDPKPMVGDPAYDLAQFLANRFIAVRSDRSRLRGEADLLAERTGLDPRRMLQWTLAREVESSLWELSLGRRDSSIRDAECAEAVASLLET